MLCCGADKSGKIFLIYTVLSDSVFILEYTLLQILRIQLRKNNDSIVERAI